MYAMLESQKGQIGSNKIAMHRPADVGLEQALTSVVPDSPDDSVLASPYQGKANNGTNCRDKAGLLST